MGQGWLCVVMVTVLVPCVSGVRGGRGRRPPKEDPLDKITPVKDLNLAQLSGKWFLISVASRCQYLRDNNFRVESTTVTLTAPAYPSSPLTVSTLRKLNLQCWDIRQQYRPTRTSGRFLLRGNRPANDIHIVVGETDYISYVILYYQKQRNISMKLYGRAEKLPDDILDKFEQLAEKQGFSIDFVFPFPKYGFCLSADEKHTLNM
ncbi:complement component C8 gamma chain [Megalops cyprinoides]|uniref:complement component C8 gamma chain n=1 Tax=Megalops cyprinoides TaxID=118141 RepID=UPI0018649FCE|nr:complement component C8 gamma chain [Megalops cyprinoides]